MQSSERRPVRVWAVVGGNGTADYASERKNNVLAWMKHLQSSFPALGPWRIVECREVIRKPRKRKAARRK